MQSSLFSGESHSTPTDQSEQVSSGVLSWIFTGGFSTLELMPWKTPVRVDPAPLFALCPSLALLYLNSARSGLPRAHEFRLKLFVIVGADFHARCLHVWKVPAVESLWIECLFCILLVLHLYASFQMLIQIDTLITDSYQLENYCNQNMV